MTKVSGTTKLFGNLASSSLAIDSALKKSAISFKSVFSSAESPLAIKNSTCSYHLLPMKGLKEENQNDSSESNKDSGSNYNSKESESNKKSYTLYPIEAKMEVI